MVNETKINEFLKKKSLELYRLYQVANDEARADLENRLNQDPELPVSVIKTILTSEPEEPLEGVSEDIKQKIREAMKAKPAIAENIKKQAQEETEWLGEKISPGNREKIMKHLKSTEQRGATEHAIVAGKPGEEPTSAMVISKGMKSFTQYPETLEARRDAKFHLMLQMIRAKNSLNHIQQRTGFSREFIEQTMKETPEQVMARRQKEIELVVKMQKEKAAKEARRKKLTGMKSLPKMPSIYRAGKPPAPRKYPGERIRSVYQPYIHLGEVMVPSMPVINIPGLNWVQGNRTVTRKPAQKPVQRSPPVQKPRVQQGMKVNFPNIQANFEVFAPALSGNTSSHRVKVNVLNTGINLGNLAKTLCPRPGKKAMKALAGGVPMLNLEAMLYNPKKKKVKS